MTTLKKYAGVLWIAVGAAITALALWLAYRHGYATAEAHYRQAMAQQEAFHAQAYARLQATYREQEQRGDELAAQVAQAETRNQQLLKEKHHAIRQATTGRACLNAGTLRLLNANDNAGDTNLPASSVNAPVADGAVATDTGVALWAADARSRYDTCRGRIDALRQFFGETHD